MVSFLYLKGLLSLSLKSKFSLRRSTKLFQSPSKMVSESMFRLISQRVQDNSLISCQRLSKINSCWTEILTEMSKFPKLILRDF
jgi:hypothetical protein